MRDPTENPMQHIGWRGGGIGEHRALRSLPYRRAELPGLALLAGGLTLAFACAYPSLAEAWTWTLAFWLERLALPGEALRLPFELPLLGEFGLLAIAMPLPPPGTGAWLANLALLAAAIVVAGLLPERAIPLRYLLRLVAAVHGIALAYFALAAERFPYSVTEHTANLYTFAIVLIGLLPGLLAATYYIVTDSWRRRIAASLLIMGFFIVSLPFKLLAHAVLVSLLSPVAMPVLYLFFGAPLDVLMLVALYSWFISWD